MTKIIRLESTNYKRLKAVEIAPDPDGNLVIVAGKNGQGKTSILDSITAALGGVNGKTTPKPIRDGEDRAEIILETEDLLVVRRFTASGSTLTVKSPDGAVYPKGQAKLDDMLGKLSLDPLAFTQLSDKEQLKTLLDLVDLPFDPRELDAARTVVFDYRTDSNRDLKRLQGQLAGYPKFDVQQDYEEVSVTDLLAQYRAGQAKNEADNKTGERYRFWADQVEALKAKLAEAEAALLQVEREVDGMTAPVDLEAIQAQIDSAEQTNATARQYSDYLKVIGEHADVATRVAALTAEIDAIDAQKSAGLAAAKFPIEGLGFDESGVTYGGVPFKQASGAEQLRVSLAMAIALNPKLRVIRIADGSLLDSDNLALVEAVAKENDFQVWIEMVGDGDGRGIVVEDGQVA